MTSNVSEQTGIAAGSVEDRDVLRDLYADWSEIMAANPELSVRLLRSLFDEWHQPTVEPEGVTYREDTVGGVPGIWCLPQGADASKVLLYTHGGGFAVGSASSHRKLAGHVAKALGVVSFVLLKLIGLVIPLRASSTDESEGLDITQHGEEAYLNMGGGTLLSETKVADPASQPVLKPARADA